MGGGAVAASSALQVGGGAFSAWQMGKQGALQEQYYNYLGDNANRNAGIARIVAKSRNKALNVEAGFQERNLADKLEVAKGEQKAAVSLGSGTSSRTAQDILKDTIDKGNLDELAIRTNTAMRSKNITDQGEIEATNDELQAGGYKLAGRNAMRSARIGQIGSVLGTGASVASDWTRYPWGGGAAGAQ